MKIDRKLILAGTGLLFVGTAMAQVQQKDSTLNRTVVVENQYNPQVMDAFKVNVLPKVEEPAVAKKHIDYATSLSPLTSYGFEPMGVITRDIQQKGARRGYLRGAYGSSNRTDVKAAYLWDMSERDRLDVMGSFYGHSGDAELPVEGGGIEENQRFYRGNIGLEYTHLFNNVKFNLGGSFANQVFNYRFVDDGSADKHPDYTLNSRNQHFLMGDGHLGLQSVEGKHPLDFDVTVGFNGFKRKYFRANMVDFLQKKIYAQGGVSGALQDDQRVGIDFGVSHLMYTAPDYLASEGTNSGPLYDLNNSTLIQLNPYYTIQTENLNVRLGAHVDIQTKVGSGLKVSPDVKLDYTFCDSYVLYVQALGGTQQSDFNYLNQVSPYWDQSVQLKPIYTMFDAQAGLKASPVNGLGLKLYGGYRFTKYDLFVTTNVYRSFGALLNSQLNQEKSKVFYAGAGIDYDFRDVFSFGVKGQYNNWKLGNKENISFLALKPEFTIGANVRTKVYRGLHALADFRYEKRKKVAGKSLDAVNFLKLGAEYNYTDRVSVYVHANNLLNRAYLTETGYPELGVNVVGGVSFTF